MKNLFPLGTGPFNCGEVNAEAGQIQSSNYPNNYPNNENCEWVITVPSGSIVTLEFETDFDVRYNCINRFFKPNRNSNNFLSRLKGDLLVNMTMLKSKMVE